MTQAKEFLTISIFYLQIDGVVDKLPVKSVSLAQMATEVPSQIMGTSRQGRPIMQATPTVINSNPIDLTVTTMIMDGDSQFFKWFKNCIGPDSGSRKVMTERKSGSVFCLKQLGTISYQCNFTNAFPKSYQPPKFDASSGDMATEEWTIVCENFMRVK